MLPNIYKYIQIHLFLLQSITINTSVVQKFFLILDAIKTDKRISRFHAGHPRIWCVLCLERCKRHEGGTETSVIEVQPYFPRG